MTILLCSIAVAADPAAPVMKGGLAGYLARKGRERAKGPAQGRAESSEADYRWPNKGESSPQDVRGAHPSRLGRTFPAVLRGILASE